MNPLSYLLEYNRYFNFLGILVVLGIAVLMSNNRRNIPWQLVSVGLGFHLFLGFLVLKIPFGRTVIEWIAGLFTTLYQSADIGIEFVFGNLANPGGPWGFIFALKVLPVIIFFGALMSLLFYLGIIQLLVQSLNALIRPLLGTTGPETLCAVANSFLGQTEAPLLIKHYLKTMTKSEFLVVMISGMGTISGAILAVFAVMGVPATHLLAASVMAIPATIIIAKIIYPETDNTNAMCDATASIESPAGNALDAISQGTSDGMWLALNVGAMLITFLALLGVIDGLLFFSLTTANNLLAFMVTSINVFLAYCITNINYYVGISLSLVSLPLFTLPILTLNTIFSWICLPFGWLLGFSGTEALQAGQLIGTKIAVNELVAYDEMLRMGLSDRTGSIVTYALCGFSNFSCIGIQIGGIGALVPEKRKWISELGMRAVFGGALANLLSAMVASLLL